MKPAVNKGKPRTILIPGENMWEYWELKNHPIKKESVSSPELLSKTPAAIAIPVSHVQTFPLWIGSTEQSLIPEMLQLQVEKRGLARLTDTALDNIPYITVNREPTRTLIVPSLLSNQLPESYKNPKFRFFESSHRIFIFTPQSITLWKELGRWNFAFVRDSQVVFTQALTGTELNASNVQLISNTWLQLESEGAAGNLLHLMCWSAPSAEEAALLETHLGLHPQIQPKPIPTLPKEPFSLTPSDLHFKQVQNQKKNRIILLAILFLLAYGITLGSWGWEAYQKQKQISVLKTEVESLRPLYQQIRKVSYDWDALQPALNPDRYPLEILMQCVSLLSNENARLTQFSTLQISTTQCKVLIQGEAKSAEIALKFTNDLKNHPPFKSFQWETPQPKLLPNQTAVFRIEGTFSYATSQ